tara:strand:+ start:904 stop:1185 length:282 start_codon:yes stop_codon:yes gene_type:complete
MILKKFPEIQAEVDGWDPSTLIVSTDQVIPWKCKECIYVTTNLSSRFRLHSSNGLIEIQKQDFCLHSGHDVYKAEKIYKRWLRKEVGLISSTT